MKNIKTYARRKFGVYTAIHKQRDSYLQCFYEELLHFVVIAILMQGNIQATY